MSYHVPPSPYAVVASTQTQTIANAANAQAITYNTTSIAKGISLAANTRITLPQVGNYALSFSAVANNSGSSSTRWFNIWLRKNGNNVDNSSTIVTLSKQIPNTVVATFDLSCTTAGDYYELMMAGEATDVQILATAAQAAVPLTNPDMPACPSIVVAIWQIN